MSPQTAVPAVVLVVVLVATVALGVWWQRRQGVVRTGARRAAGARVPGGSAADDARPAVDWAARGVELGPRRTFVQFSAQVCAPCRATARVLAEVSGAEDGVSHRELDVDDHLDLVLAFGILRTPTVVVLDADGRETARASGAMTRSQALAALAVASPAPAPSS